MLDTLNIWVDVVGTFIAIAVVLGFIVPHFLASVITGRVRKHFLEDYWDGLAHRAHDPQTYGYGTPLSDDFPPPTRVWHWVNLVSFMFLLISGVYIRYPFFPGGREIMRFIHYIFMYIITANLIFRLAYLGVNGNWRSYFLFDLQDLKLAPAIIKYYSFLGPPYPHLKKLNPLQRPTYPMLWALLGLQAITGFLIWQPTLAPGFVAGNLGGFAALAAWARLVHSVNMRLMVMIATIHSYLGVMEDYPVLKVFWFWQEPDMSKYEHEHGHGEGHGEHAVGGEEAVQTPAD